MKYSRVLFSPERTLARLGVSFVALSSMPLRDRRKTNAKSTRTWCDRHETSATPKTALRDKRESFTLSTTIFCEGRETILTFTRTLCDRQALGNVENRFVRLERDLHVANDNFW